MEMVFRNFEDAKNFAENFAARTDLEVEFE